MLHQDESVLIDFTKEQDVSNWKLVNDVVMGGKSQSNFYWETGYVNFKGQVSLENNGGFSMLSYPFERKKIESFTKIIVLLKGDGKQYQFRVKSDRSERHWYVKEFKTNGEWQFVEFCLKDMQAKFRGRVLELPNFPGKTLEEIAFLIGNKKEELFHLKIKWIALQ